MFPDCSKLKKPDKYSNLLFLMSILLIKVYGPLIKYSSIIYGYVISN